MRAKAMTARKDSAAGFSAAVLCGGKSRRAGFDKQTIRIDGQWIAVQIAQALAHVFNDVLLVTNRPELYRDSGFRVVGDILPDAGPLGGIHAGLTYAKQEQLFVTACDMPYVNEGYLRWLCRAAVDEGAAKDALVVRLENDMLEPMNAIYRKNCLPQVERSIIGGERKIADLLERMDTLYLPESALAPFGGRETLFFNMNTPEEIQYYQSRQNTR